MSMNVKKRIGLAAGATLFALATCELATRAMFPAPPDPTRQPQIVYQSDPDIRYVLAPQQRGWIDDGFVTTNSLGFRGREVVLPKPHGRLRIVAIGDSITFGWGVNDDDTFCARIEQLLREKFAGRDLDVVNLGVGGYDTWQEVALLKRNAARLQPDLVLVGFYSNDVPESLGDKETTTTPESPSASGGAEAGRILHLNPAPSSWWIAQLRKSRAIYTTGRVVNRLSHRGEWGASSFSMELDLLQGRDSSELMTAWGRVAGQLNELRSMATTLGFSVGVVVLPPREQVLGVYPNASYQSKLRAIASQLGFHVIDPLPALVKSRRQIDALFIPYDRNHPSAVGHRVLAQTIVEQLEQQNGLGRAPERHARSGSPE
jgi:lysophospholipase L1-like esterase